MCIFAFFIQTWSFMALRFRLLWFVCLLSISLSAQSFGIRAGLNYTQFSGPLEEGVGEKFSLANGFHFGVNYAYPFAEDLAVRGELVYTQVGTGYSYDGESFYKIPIGNAFVYEKGRSTIKMKISNAYVSLPISVSWQANKKWELSAGAYVSFLIGPRGNGTIYFEKNPDSLFFKQSLIHNYYNDAAGGVATGSTGPSVWVDGKIVTLARDAGAYYNYLSTEKVGNMYNFLDLGLTGSVNYFINKGFFVGFKYSYGLLDVTNNGMDVLRKQYDETINRAIPANHFDRNTGFEVSFGFRF
jgi:hypothetical protein